jgi:hypothetical protein
LLNPGVNAVLRKPSWGGSESIFRFWPSLSYENPAQEMQPYRLDAAGKNLFSDWIRKYEVIESVGNPPITMFAHTPDFDFVYDPWTTPIGMLYSAVNKAIKAHTAPAEWYSLTAPAAGKSKALSLPKSKFVMQGYVVKHNDKLTFRQGEAPLGWAIGEPTVIVMVSESAGAKMLEKLSVENENYRGEPFDFNARYKEGDPVSIDSGLFVHFFEAGKDPRQKYMAKPEVRSEATAQFVTTTSRGNNSGAPESKEFKSYDLFFSKDAGMGLRANLKGPGETDIVRDHWRFWEDALRFFSYQEQAHLLYNRFPPALCAYAFKDYCIDWLPEDYKAREANATSVGFADVVPQPQPGNQFTGFQQAPATTSAPTSPWNALPQAVQTPPRPTSPQATQDSVVPVGQVPTGGVEALVGGEFSTAPATPSVSAAAIAALKAARQVAGKR